MADSGDKALRLVKLLQSTLELRKILELFGDEVKSSVQYDGFSYEYAEDNCRINIGEQATCQCSYPLNLTDSQMGEVTFYRQAQFNAEEQKLLENLVAVLIYPVRNALLYRQAVERAHRDPLTGIGNRAAMDKALEQEFDMARRYHAPLSVIILDIDKFKPVNDTYGHMTGDTVLRTVSDCIVEHMRRSDIIYRYGGEEFLILLRNTHTPGAALLAERIRQAVEKMAVSHGDAHIQVTISAGIASLQHNEDINSLLMRCDKALYNAKLHGRNRVSVG